MLTPEQYASLLARPEEERPPEIRALKKKIEERSALAIESRHRWSPALYRSMQEELRGYKEQLFMLYDQWHQQLYGSR